MTDERVRPAGIGPHEDRELELMLAGRKPLAMFSDTPEASGVFPEAAFAPYVTDGTLVRREFICRLGGCGAAIRFLYFARPGEEWRIEALHQINEALHVRGTPTTPETERQIGRLLGYDESDIEQYIAWLERFRARRRDT